MNRLHKISNRLILALFMLMGAGSIILNAQPAPEHVEPPFWWADMHHNELQIMVYGQDIGLTRVEIDYPGVTIKEVVSVESPNYLFISLDLSGAIPGSFPVLFRQGRRVQYRYTFELKEREPGSRYRKGFNTSDAIYLLMPDRFANGDPSNDNIPDMLEQADRSNPNGRHGGDIQGIINNLGHIAGMGFTSIWINPLLENDQPRYSYHGYATTDFYKIDARFGSNEDYRRLVQEARQQGLGVIKDMIFNHCGHHHWWMADLPANDWLNQWDEFTRTTYRMTTIIDPYAANADYEIMLNGWFDRNMPDLNQQNRLLATYLIQNSVWWIEYAGLHGIRMDTQPYADRFFMARWGKHVMEEYPNFMIVGESWIGIPAISSYFQGGKNNHDGYDSHIPSVFDFSLYDAIGMAFREGDGWNSGMMRLYNSLAQDFLYPDPFRLVVFGDNHDTDRFFTRVGEKPDKLKMALTLLFTTRGIPQMYTGTELLKSAYEHDGHGPMRSNFPGGWEDDTTNAFTREGRTPQQNEIVDHIASLLKYRKEKSVLQEGKLIQFVPHGNIYVYVRYDEHDRVMVIINNNEQEQVLQMDRFTEALSGYTGGRDVISGQTFNQLEQIVIPGNKSFVLELH